MTRTHTAIRTVTAGCDRCGVVWRAKNAQGLAVQHTDRRKHRTWVEIRIDYSKVGGESPQAALF